MSHRNSPPATVHVVPFSHLDLFWMGTREECLSRGNYIISHALDLLEKHEDFTFLIETVNFLDNYVQCYPDEKERVKRLASSGRLELAPLWSAIYQNLPGGETLVRNTLYAKRYVLEHFGCNPETAHFADLPGYTPQYPQIAALSGIKHVLMSRGGPADTPLFDWEGLNGTRIRSYYVVLGYATLALETAWHKDYASMASGSTEKMLHTVIDGKKHPSLVHWGCDLYAPDENIILNVRRWNLEKQPKLQFSTFRKYFSEVSEIKDVPVLKGELPSAWPNMESSWPDIWPEDLPCEHALQMAEFLSTFCLLRGWKGYPEAELRDAWKALLDAMDHNQNGQGGERADHDKLQLKRYSRYAAERITDRMAWRLAAQVPIPAADMFPVVVFNSMSWRRSGIVHGRAVVFGVPCSGDVTAFEAGLKLISDKGVVVPYVQLARLEGMSIALEIAFPADEIPAVGYRTWYLVAGHNPVNEGETSAVALDQEADRNSNVSLPVSVDRRIQLGPRRSLGSDRCENRFFNLTIDRVTGEISLYDRHTGKLLLEKIAIVGVEERRGNYIFNMAKSGRSFAAMLNSVETIDNNAVWHRLRIRGSVYSVPFTQTLTLFHDYAEVLLENEIDWPEPTHWVRIQQLFPWTGQGETIRYGVPYGQVTHPGAMSVSLGRGHDEIKPEEHQKLRLCRHWVDIGDDSAGVTIGCDHRMWEFNGRLLRAYMVRGIGYCFGAKRNTDGELENIPRPPAGKYQFRYVIRPRNASLANSGAYRCGWELNRPLLATAVGGSNNRGVLPASAGLCDFTDTSLVVTAIKKAEDGDGVVLRAFESAGQNSAFPVPEIQGLNPSETNLLEETRQPPSPCGPFAVKTLIFETQQA